MATGRDRAYGRWMRSRKLPCLALALASLASGCARCDRAASGDEQVKPAPEHARATSSPSSSSSSGSTSAARAKPKRAAGKGASSGETRASRWVEDGEVYAWPTTPPPAGTIVRVDPTHFLIDRAALEDLYRDLAGALKTTRIFVVNPDGGAPTVRIASLPPGAKLRELGLEKGDEPTALSGLTLADPDAALEAYATLRSKGSAFLQLERAGAPMTIHYRIVDRR